MRGMSLWLVGLLCLLGSEGALTAERQTYNGSVCAFADFNFDRYTDVVVRRGDERLVVLLASTDSSAFDAAAFHIDVDAALSCAVADFNGDALPDVLAMSNDRQVRICFGSPDNSFKCNEEGTSWKVKSDPLILDFDADGVADLMLPLDNGSVVCAHLIGTKEQKLTPCFKSDEALRSDFLLTYVDAYNPKADEADMNPDVVFGFDGDKQQLALALWYMDVDARSWTRFDLAALPQIDAKRFGRLTAADFDADGKTDLLLPACLDEKCARLKLLVWSHVRGWTKPIDLSLIDKDDMEWHAADEGDSASFQLRAGDYTLDGRADLLVVLKAEGRRAAFVVENTECEGGHCDVWARSFRVQWSPVLDAADITVATFFDVEEDGVLDVLVEQKTAAGCQLTFVPSHEYADATFVKVQVSAPCMAAECAETSGVSAPGATLRYSTSDFTGLSVGGVATQLSQTGARALQLPYVLFGLGANPNYVERLVVAIPSWTLDSHVWQQIVPNARLYVIPSGDRPPRHWTGRLYLAPSRLVWLSVASLSAVCAVTLLIVIALYWRERRQDRIEKKQQAHRFHFDAM